MRRDGYKIQELFILSHRRSGSRQRQGGPMEDYGYLWASCHEQKVDLVAASQFSECLMYDVVGGMWGFQRNSALGWDGRSVMQVRLRSLERY